MVGAFDVDGREVRGIGALMLWVVIDWSWVETTPESENDRADGSSCGSVEMPASNSMGPGGDDSTREDDCVETSTVLLLSGMSTSCFDSESIPDIDDGLVDNKP